MAFRFYTSDEIVVAQRNWSSKQGNVYSRMQFRDICSSRLRSDDALHFVLQRCCLSPCLETRRVAAVLWDTLECFLGQVAAGI